ncbi:hypothetical protein IU459_05955 [Nocardia amamiensis]|uniref:CHY-type domain-containing protein n=1 Tax=Nocardia amamiensis TaxID=404578 RepID=A0ABS0CKE5_9NOCA|nr:hypothetical protein [Nocardia amamiensis]MBF6297087.1 hypothetical protein [Nocardia amamiensis]
MRTAASTTTFEAIVAGLPAEPMCTFRFDGARCRHRADWLIRKRSCCHTAGVDFLCETCHARINWMLDLGMAFECTGCGARSTGFAELCPTVAPL